MRDTTKIKLIPSQFVTSSVMLCCLLCLRPLNLKQGSLLSYKQISNTLGSGADHCLKIIWNIKDSIMHRERLANVILRKKRLFLRIYMRYELIVHFGELVITYYLYAFLYR